MNHERPTKPDAALLPHEVEARLLALIEGRISGQIVIEVHDGRVMRARVTENIEWGMKR